MKELTHYLTLFFFALTLFTSCKNDTNKPETPEFSEEVAQIIQHITTGNIRRGDEVKLVFHHPVISDDQVGAEVEDLFNFSPSVSGRAYWEDTRTIIFEPSSLLRSRTTYEVQVDLTEADSSIRQDIEPVKLYLHVMGREISEFGGELVLTDKSSPKLLTYQGTIDFSEDTDLEKLKSAAKITGPGDINIRWNTIGNHSFQFQTDPIERSGEDKHYKLTLDRKPLDLAEDFVASFQISPLGEMKTIEVSKDESGRQPRIRIKFSDELAANQNIEGFINLKPNIDFSTKKMGKFILVDGEFKFGTSYQIEIKPGIKSKWRSESKSEFITEVKFSNIYPQIEFASNGFILPSSNNKSIQFYAVNLSKVHVEVKKIFGNGIREFLQSEQLTSKKDRNSDFNNSYTRQVGVIVMNKSLDLEQERNSWKLHEIDLSQLFLKYSDGLFLLRLTFNHQDMIVRPDKQMLDYLVDEGQIYKPVMLSDLGLSIKRTDNRVMAFVTDLKTTKPVAGVTVRTYSYGRDARSTATTNSQGIAELGNDYFFYATATYGNQISAIKTREMEWSTSGFDVSGTADHNQTRAFIFTERGVYRPGDSVHVSLIARNENHSFPDNHPVNLLVRDPEGKVVFEQTSREGKNGFYTFGFSTDDNAPTGTYSVMVKAGSRRFYDNLKIETVVAEKLAVVIDPTLTNLNFDDSELTFEMQSRYLFGTPASGLPAEASVEITSLNKSFPKYEDFVFSNNNIDFNPIQDDIFSGNLDAEGKASVSWKLPSLTSAPSALRIRLNATVLEEGGRPNKGWKFITMDPYPAYVGVKEPSGYGYFATGSKVEFPVILLSPEGDMVADRDLNYRIFRNDKHWWYQYDSRKQFRLKYKEDKNTYLVEEGSVSSSSGPVSISFTPDQRGEYLLEVRDARPNGHVSSFFFSSYPYGSVPGGDANQGTLALKSDQEEYNPGEKAKINFPVPPEGKILMTVEKGSEIVKYQWLEPNPVDGEMTLEVPITADMAPNVYLSLMVLQPHEQTKNDRPLRMFGILPIKVVDPATVLDYRIDAPATLSPNKPFEVKVSTQNRKPSQFTIAMVDEGLLSLTQFRTPDPWSDFYRKLSLGVRTFDLYGNVISANLDDVFKTFSIGGAEEMSYRDSQTPPLDGKKRFKPVSVFKGPIKTDASGNATIKFEMPNYNGAVRFMVVGAAGKSYGSAEKRVKVVSDLVMQPTIPRVLHPGDEFEIVVNLFKTDPNIKSADVQLTLDGPLKAERQSAGLNFANQENGQVRFKVSVHEAIGQAKINLKAKSGSTEVTSQTDIMVVPAASRVFESEDKIIEKGIPVRLDVPNVGIKGSEYASLSIQLFPNMNFEHRLRWLIHYPYGCVEQTTSTVFAQLALKQVGVLSSTEQLEVDRNINEGIRRLQLFELPGGGFSYWPGGDKPSEWGTNYATHFLVEARQKGYAVPDYLYDQATGYLERQARNHTGKLITRVNRVLVLALAEKAQMGEMNLIRENELEKLSDAEKWMLASAYRLAGVTATANSIIGRSGKSAQTYDPFSHSYGSAERDQAIILNSMIINERREDAETLAKEMARILSGRNWYSTQTVGYMLLALGHFFEEIGLDAGSAVDIEGFLELAGGETMPFDQVKSVYLPIKNNFGKSIAIHLKDGTTADKLYATLNYNGVPLEDKAPAMAKNLDLQVRYYAKDGNEINPSFVNQGEAFFARYTVENTSAVSRAEEIALVQLLPSGWEIENLRVTGESLPSWTENWNLQREDYLDIRDDRVMWFFDLEKNQPLDFVIKINAVTVGKYVLPATLTEAMYNNEFRARNESKMVEVESSK